MMRNRLWAVVVMVLALPALAQAQYPVISYYSGPPPVVVSEPVVSYYPPAPVVSYYAGPAPVVSYHAPVVSYYAPAPVVSYYAPAPVVSYYAAPAPVSVTTYRYGLLGRRAVTTVSYGW